MGGRFSSKSLTLLLVFALPFFALGAPSSELKPESKDHPLTLLQVSPDEFPAPVSEDVNRPSEALEMAPSDPNALFSLRRKKREFYDRDPWGRMPQDKPYYKRRGNGRITRYNTRKFSRGRRREHHGYRGPDYGDDFEETIHEKTNSGYIDTAAFDKQSEPKRNFVSARASGVARKETTGGS
ncbi:uncharacterized protein [Palaemon carinicauda]|uniref:uncharacterized protein n=1 Tax=Palaemon carinicauda TaxID=392227 RepID=UPI0035B5A818